MRGLKSLIVEPAGFVWHLSNWERVEKQKFVEVFQNFTRI